MESTINKALETLNRTEAIATMREAQKIALAKQLGIPLEIAKGFGPKLRKLVGYGLYMRLLGHIDKCSPVDLLDGTGPRRVVGEV